MWASRLLIVHADTVARWHRDRFRRYWAKISQRRHPGRPRIDAEIRRLVRTMAQDGWGAPRIHAELTKLGFIISEITVSRYLPRRPAEPDQLKRWMAFLRNHKDDIAAMDLFTVPTASLRLLYGFFVIEHGRRHIVHFNATFHPTSDFFTAEVWTQGGLVTYYVLFFIHLAARRVHVAGITPHPNEQWMTQVACNVTMADVGFVSSSRYLIHDRDWRCCTARSKSLTSLCRLQSHPAQYVSGIPSAAILLSISHPIRCSTRCLANVRARISGPMIAL